MKDKSSLKILLAEDSKITRRMEVKVLNELGYKNIIEADDGEHAIDILKKDPDVDLVISDWNMPNMGGIDFLRWIRSSERFKDLPFILATGRAQKKEVAIATEEGASNIISKPFAPVELKKVIEETLAGKTLQEKSKRGIQERQAEKDEHGRLVLNMAHIQITDHLTLGVVKHLIETEKVKPRHFTLKTHCMTSWNPVQEALENGTVDGAFILAPIAMDLFAYDVPVKMVLLAHKNGSICVRKKENISQLVDFFKSRTFCIPHELSIHHMLSHMFLTEMGLKPAIAGATEGDFYYEVVPPVKMPEFLKMNPDASGFLVAEPIGTKAIAEGVAELLFLSAELWQNHPCCVVALRSEIIEKYGDAVDEFVRLLVQAGDLISKRTEMAAEIGVAFLDPNKVLGLKVPILKNVLSEEQGIKTDDLLPDKEALDIMQKYMHEQMEVGSIIDLSEFVITDFAERAYKEQVAYSPRISRILDVQSLILRVQRDLKEGKKSAKSKLAQEGKYLIFQMADQFYGFDILNVKEIIGLLPIRSLPQVPPYVKGVINLRGKIIPVVDLRLKLGFDSVEYDSRACIIILEVPYEGRLINIGVIVEAVSHVENIKATDVEDTKTAGVGKGLGFISAIAKTRDGLKVLLDAGNLFQEGELERLARAA